MMKSELLQRSKPVKIGLALGSGGARGLAHIGVIKVLKENHIPIDVIAGSSIGALIGGLYAATGEIKQIEEEATSMKWHQLLSMIDAAFFGGFLGGEKIKKFIESHIGKIDFKELGIPFSAVASDLETGEVVSINQGEVAKAIRASISIPLVFRPLKCQERLLVDGGFSLPVPAEIARNMGAELVIAVNLDADYFGDKQNGDVGFFKIANNSINLIRYHLSFLNCKEADIVISPKVGKVRWIKFLNCENIISRGEEATRAILPNLRELMHPVF